MNISIQNSRNTRIISNLDITSEQPYLLKNRQVSFFCYPNFESGCFTPARWCHRQWKNLTTPLEQDQCVLAQVLKRIFLVVPLVVATLVAYLAAIPGFLTCKITITTDNNVNTVSIIGSNHRMTRRTDLNASVLRAVELRTLGNVVITSTGQEQYIEVTADDNLLDYLTLQVNGQSLILSVQEGIAIKSTRNPISYHLHIPHAMLNKLLVSGSGSLEVDRLETEELNCKISGQATIKINSGHITRQTVVISGEGDYDASHVQTDHSNIKISGQGKAHIHAHQSLNVTISGEGVCIYSGNPQLQQKISGVGQITHVGLNSQG